MVGQSSTLISEHQNLIVKRAILAKAYSNLRGSREKEEAPLDGFLTICAPMIGVIPPNEYQEMMGWKLSPAKEDDVVCCCELRYTLIAGDC